MGPKKRQKTNLSIEQKFEIVQQLLKGKSQSAVMLQRDLPKSTVSGYWTNRDKIIADYIKGRGSAKRIRLTKYESVDTALAKWMDSMSDKKVTLNSVVCMIQATSFARALGFSSWTCSRGWFDRFKKRHAISFRKLCGETADRDLKAAENWIKNVWPMISTGFKSDEIYNADETGLFYKALPNKTYIVQGQSCPGGEMAKERLTVLVCANLTGTDKKRLLIIGKSKNPRPFQNVNKLPVDYFHSKNAWMTADIFKNWLTTWDKSLRQRNHKILLLIDNCSAHKNLPKLTNIRLEFFPPNLACLIQPTDQGIIYSLKSHYRKKIVDAFVENANVNTPTRFNILHAVKFLHAAWNDVTPPVIVSCFDALMLNEDPVVDYAAYEEFPDCDDDNLELPIYEDPFAACKNIDLPDGLTFQEFVAIDQDLITSECETEEQIIESVRGLTSEVKTDAENHSSSEDEEEEPENETISSSQAFSHMEELEKYVMCNITNEKLNSECLLQISLLKATIIKAQSEYSS